MAGTGWSYFVDFMFPLPLVMLALLSIPMPAIIRQPARRAVLFICDKVCKWRENDGLCTNSICLTCLWHWFA